jgi:Flp pilus assembly protein TadD
MRWENIEGTIELTFASSPKKDSPFISESLQNGLTHHQAGRLEEAEAIYQSILQEYPQHPGALHLLGVIAHQVGKHDIAVNLIESAIKINPNVPDFYNNCGEAYRALHKNDVAVTCYEHALAIKPGFAEAHGNLGIALQDLGRQEEAIVHYEQALAIKHDYAEAHNNLGAALQELGQQEDAIANYEQALAIKPNYAAAHRHLAMIKPMQEQIPIIEKFLADSVTSEEDAMHYHYALGNILNENNSYSNSFEHYLKANTLKRKKITFIAQNFSTFVDKLINAYSKSSFQEKIVVGSDSELPVFIVGMPRSGTTLVEQIVSSHPQVYGAGELDSFERIENAITKQYEASSPYPECLTLSNDTITKKYSAEYLKEIEGYSQEALRITDKMPGNFIRIGLIKTLFPHARIIHCQRNALDTCTSIFLNYFDKGHTYSLDLKELGQYYLDYVRLMAHWRSLFSTEIFEVQYEEIVMHQEKVSRQLIAYLGLEWNEKCLDFHRKKRAVRTLSNLQVRKPIYKNSINRWKHYEKNLDLLVEILQQLNDDCEEM